LSEKNNQHQIHTVTILLGSNINAEQNLRLANQALEKRCRIQRVSSIWQTKAAGSHGADFLNQAVQLQTSLEMDEFKYQILRRIEQELGRVRTTDKYADRTIDLDIILFDGRVIEPGIWTHCFMAAPVSELHPNLQQSEDAKTLQQAAREFQCNSLVRLFKKTGR